MLPLSQQQVQQGAHNTRPALLALCLQGTKGRGGPLVQLPSQAGQSNKICASRRHGWSSHNWAAPAEQRRTPAASSVPRRQHSACGAQAAGEPTRPPTHRQLPKLPLQRLGGVAAHVTDHLSAQQVATLRGAGGGVAGKSRRASLRGLAPPPPTPHHMTQHRPPPHPTPAPPAHLHLQHQLQRAAATAGLAQEARVERQLVAHLRGGHSRRRAGSQHHQRAPEVAWQRATWMDPRAGCWPAIGRENPLTS